LDLLDTVAEMNGLLLKLKDPETAVQDCLAALGAILNQLEQEKESPSHTIELLKGTQGYFNAFWNGEIEVNAATIQELSEKIALLKATLKDEVSVKLNVVFLPYKASMWDSLATVYEAAAKDENCVARVVPIPYYQLSQNEAIPTYEGDRFPANVPITHYNEYNLEQEEPDIIFVHNIYDQYNTITRVHEHFFTSNLKQFTNMLVYVPYHISSFVKQENNIDRSYDIPSVKNVDKIIVAGEFLKEAAVRFGVPEEKVLVLGSPKLDSMIKVINNEISYPEEWKRKIEGKTVYLLNTGCTYFAGNTNAKLERLMDFIHFPRYVENSVVIWRPHPLTKISIMKYTPHLLEYYIDLTENRINGDFKSYQHIILDESDDYLPALQAADVLISSEGSLLRSFLLTEKKILFWGAEMPKGSLLPADSFYYTFDSSEMWYERIKGFSKGVDPFAEKRKGMASKIYANTDGTSGRKVYESIKQCVMQSE
jgi:Putative glycosyl/glycerophosphate transferases involved in teichoic acid biosynthesis TagF/TagB/EpsJ/RodC